MAESLKCSLIECKKRCSDAKNMGFKELDRYVARCNGCGSWILKETKVANDTYNEVSNRWAEEFMKKMMKK